MAMRWHRYVRPAPAVARRPGRSVKGPHEGRQSEGVWKTIARDSLSRRNGKLQTQPGEARLSRALPDRFSRSGADSRRLSPRQKGPAKPVTAAAP